MSDFADGIAPQRYPCRRPGFAGCHQRNLCNPSQTTPRRLEQVVADKPHWSLDEGRWKAPGVALKNDRVVPPPSPSDGNVFVGFKRFIDRNVDILTSGPMRRTQVEAEQQLKQDARTRWAGESSPLVPSPAAVSSSNDAQEATRLLLRRAELLTLDVPSHAIQALFQEDPLDYAYKPDSMANAMLAFGGACYFLPEIGDRLPSSRNLFRPTPRPPRWLSIDWFQDSPYSPLNIEVDASLPGPREKWRAAFTDLVTLALDRPLPPPSPSSEARLFGYEHFPLRLEPGMDWVVGLQLRGILPPLMPRLQAAQGVTKQSSVTTRGGQWDFEQLANAIETSNRAASILQTCQELVGSGSRGLDTSAKTLPPHPHLPPNPSSQNLARGPNHTPADFRPAAEPQHSDPYPCIVSNLPKSALLLTVETTSKTTRTTDGKVSTQTVVRRRYDDGTEEEWETVHSSTDSSTPSG